MMKFDRFILVLVLLLALAPLVRAAEIPPREKAPNDDSEYRRLVLDNGLEVILLSDPKLNKSAAAMAVGVGSLSNPKERQGLAHFLEHMLFLGTEKYPDEAEYGNFLRSNGGYSNAYTASDHTNYHFEIRHEALEGALDRFSQFFIAPLFTPEFTEREMNAVNSEYQKNLENDSWREYMLLLSLLREGHPASGFSIGNRETLAGTSQEELLTFYREHYSANQMALAITGKAGLDQLEAWAREYFSAISNRDLPQLRYPSDVLAPEKALRVALIEPVKDLRQLGMNFPLPGTREMWPGKSVELISFILGYEGEGSLLSALKAEGLATTLAAAAHDESADYGFFSVDVGLTPAGMENRSRVLGRFFATVAGMKREGYPHYLFEERRALARLDEEYADKGDGASRAVALANRVREYGLEIAEREPFLWLEPDPEGYMRLLGELRPDNMLVSVMVRGVPTDRTERYFDAKYSYQEITGTAFDALLDPPAVASIHLPKPNPFIPMDASLLAIRPTRLIDEPATSLYYLQDIEFERPMAAQIHRFVLSRSMGRLKNAVMLRFYEACVNEALNEISYAAAAAGLKLSVSAALDGVQVSIDGYDESADKLVEAVAANLLDFKLSEDRFVAIKDRLVRDLRNFTRADAYLILRETRRAVVSEFYFRPDEQLPAAEKVTLTGVREFAGTLFRQGKLESFVHGNVTPDEAIGATRKLAATLKHTGVTADQLLRRRLLVQSKGEALLGTEKLVVNNSAFRQEYLLGGDEPEIRAATLVLANFVGEPFFTELRTRQQLGYIVGGGAGAEERTHFAYFIIQSGEHPADELQARAEAFIAGLPEMLQSIPEEAWEMIVAGAKSKLEEEDKTIAERAARLFGLAYDYVGDWSRRKDNIAALDALTRERAVEILATALDPANFGKRTFLGFSRDHEPKAPLTNDFADRAKWKSKHLYR
ncbi:MAG TPA: insulinase family protein [Opitutaceae bacterium]